MRRTSALTHTRYRRCTRSMSVYLGVHLQFLFFYLLRFFFNDMSIWGLRLRLWESVICLSIQAFLLCPSKAFVIYSLIEKKWFLVVFVWLIILRFTVACEHACKREWYQRDIETYEHFCFSFDAKRRISAWVGVGTCDRAKCIADREPNRKMKERVFFPPSRAYRKSKKSKTFTFLSIPNRSLTYFSGALHTNYACVRGFGKCNVWCCMRMPRFYHNL